MKTLWQKEKLLCISHFFFNHNVFKKLSTAEASETMCVGAELYIRGICQVLKSLFDTQTQCCGDPKESSQRDYSFKYPQNRVWLSNKRDIVGKRPVYSPLSCPLYE